MSITKSYNKHTDTYYAYDTTYVWDEKSQKKIQKKVCIGKFDPDTGKIIPNAKRGRPSKSDLYPDHVIAEDSQILTATASASDEQITAILEEMKEIRGSFDTLLSRFKALEKKLENLQAPGSVE